jgi:hypothetical protein
MGRFLAMESRILSVNSDHNLSYAVFSYARERQAIGKNKGAHRRDLWFFCSIYNYNALFIMKINKFNATLSSLRLTTITIVGLIIWFLWGIFLARSEILNNGFHIMNSLLVRDWLISHQTGFQILKLWFVGLCLLTTILGINLILCTWTKFYKIIRIRKSSSNLFILFIHVIFGLVAMTHFGMFMLGSKYDDVRIGENQSFNFNNDYKITVLKVSFKDDPAILEKSKPNLYQNRFNPHSNFAEIVLKQKGKELIRDKVYFLKPLNYGNIQITAKRFIKPDAVLIISNNPLKYIFLITYPLMIICTGIYLVMTWQNKFVNKPI